MPADTAINILEDLMGKRFVAQLRKTSNGNIMIEVNKMKGSMQLVQKIQQGETTLQLYNGITIGHLSTDNKKWIIKRVVTYISKEKLQASTKEKTHQ